MLARVGPKGLPVATPSVCLYNIPLNQNKIPLVTMSKSFLKIYLIKAKFFISLIKQ